MNEVSQFAIIHDIAVSCWYFNTSSAVIYQPKKQSTSNCKITTLILM